MISANEEAWKLSNHEWKLSKNRTKAYEKAKEAIESSIKRLSIVNKGAITGLRAELLYYFLEFDRQRLVPEPAVGLHSDFRAIIRQRPAAIDVTTTPNYKDPDQFMRVREAFGKDWDYYVGVIDLKNPDAKTYPLLLPICEDGSKGHFILVLETEEYEYTSDRQMLVRYNPYAQDDDDALEKVQASWNYIVSNPAMVWKDCQDDYSDIHDESYARLVLRDFLGFGSGMAHEFKQESGFIISAIVTCEREYYKPLDQEDWVTRLWWVHPHSFVKGTLGKQFGELEHNIAGVAYDL